MVSPRLQSLLTAKDPQRMHIRSQMVALLDVQAVCQLTEGSQAVSEGRCTVLPEKKGKKSQRMVPENQPIGLKPRLSRELGLAEKRLECYPPCSEWGQPDNSVPILSAQRQQQGCGQISCLSKMSVSGLEL